MASAAVIGDVSVYTGHRSAVVFTAFPCQQQTVNRTEVMSPLHRQLPHQVDSCAALCVTTTISHHSHQPVLLCRAMGPVMKTRQVCTSASL